MRAPFIRVQVSQTRREINTKANESEKRDESMQAGGKVRRRRQKKKWSLGPTAQKYQPPPRFSTIAPIDIREETHGCLQGKRTPKKKKSFNIEIRPFFASKTWQGHALSPSPPYQRTAPWTSPRPGNTSARCRHSGRTESTRAPVIMCPKSHHGDGQRRGNAETASGMVSRNGCRKG